MSPLPGAGGFRPRGGGGRRFFKREAPPEAHRINEKILAPQVRVVKEDGEQLGIMTVRDAIRIAEEEGLDLVEIAPQAKPPVCKIMDYGKFKYKEQKKEADSKKKRSEQTIKEIRISYRIDVGDMETKLKHARSFLTDGDKVKFSMRFRGREIVFMDLGVKKFEEIKEKLSDIADVDDQSPPQGRMIHMTLAPAKKKKEE